MCPACISSIVLATAGATSTGVAGIFAARRFASIARLWKPQQPKTKENLS